MDTMTALALLQAIVCESCASGCNPIGSVDCPALNALSDIRDRLESADRLFAAAKAWESMEGHSAVEDLKAAVYEWGRK